MKVVFVILLVCCSATVAAQQDPDFMVSVARGWQFNPDGWKLDRNADVSLGCRIWPHGMAIAAIDYNRFSYDQYKYVAYRRKTSILAGAKVSLVIPERPVIPYFEGALGFSNITSSIDTVSEIVGNMGLRNTYRVDSGNTVSFLAAVGVDVEVYRGVFALLELRTTFGLDTNLYDLMIQYRAGVGFSF